MVISSQIHKVISMNPNDKKDDRLFELLLYRVSQFGNLLTQRRKSFLMHAFFNWLCFNKFDMFLDLVFSPRVLSVEKRREKASFSSSWSSVRWLSPIFVTRSPWAAAHCRPAREGRYRRRIWGGVEGDLWRCCPCFSVNAVICQLETGREEFR
jgi:hypothetical protein